MVFRLSSHSCTLFHCTFFSFLRCWKHIVTSSWQGLQHLIALSCSWVHLGSLSKLSQSSVFFLTADGTCIRKAAAAAAELLPPYCTEVWPKNAGQMISCWHKALRMAFRCALWSFLSWIFILKDYGFTSVRLTFCFLSAWISAFMMKSFSASFANIKDPHK